ncbi:hypothetical protein KAR52_00225 [Candidatus Pacearchaeota archaeon]|nr:hypothetical protein [Candidatus Pacearchaeota archaeon]
MVKKENSPKIINPKIFELLKDSFKELTKIRKKPLLVMFYNDSAGQILPYDIEALEGVFDDFLKSKKKEGFLELDLLIHTHGGEAHTAYRLIQMIRSYCKQLNVLVATYAHSGGTLIAFGATKVEMGRTATLSPVDVQIWKENEDNAFSLLSIEKYTEFLENTVREHNFLNEKNKAYFLTELTKKLIEEVEPSKLGELFRLRSLTELHSKALLHNYMLKNLSEKEALADKIISKFTKESPTHQFLMDYEIVKESGLNVKKMEEKVYKLSCSLIDKLKLLERVGLICDFYPSSIKKRQPFFKIYDAEEKSNEKKQKK